MTVRREYTRLAPLSMATTAIVFVLASAVRAHEHHQDNIPEGEVISVDPIDSILWTHILLQTFTFGIIFPTGMVLGIIKSRWHVPTQVLGTLLAVVGYFLGHKHKGRQFLPNIHSRFAPTLNFMLFVQVVLGIYLRLHIERGFLGKIRRWLVVVHGVLGKAMPVVSWVQMLFGGISALGFCHDDHMGQCLAHFIMGSAFIGYGIILTLLLLVGQGWIRRTGKSQEFFDSIVIAAWGCVNTFTEHRWGGPWVHNDLQHTSMGIVWWAAGLLGIWLSRTRDGRPKRNLIPAIVIMLTGYGMSGHPQNLELSTMVHRFFGYTLMLAGLCRVIEISFVLKDRGTLSIDGYDPNSFQYLTPFLLYASGFLFMGATEEQMLLMSEAHVTHVSYILILYSIAFLLFLFVNILLHLYAVYAFPPSERQSSRREGRAGRSRRQPQKLEEDEDLENHANGAAHGGANGRPVGCGLGPSEHQRVKDAEEFELDALISDDEDNSLLKHRVAGPGDSPINGARTGDEGKLRLR